MNVHIRIVLQQRVVTVLVLVLRSAVWRMMTGIRRRVGWSDSGPSSEVVGVAERVIVIVARYEMRGDVRLVSAD